MERSRLAAWARANLLPASTSLAEAIRLSHEVHATHDGRRVGLGWHFEDEMLWHNGATGSFQSMLVIEPGARAVAGLATFGPSKEYSLDAPIMRWILDGA